MLERANGADVLADPQEAAESAGLCYVCDDSPGLRRRKAGRGFVYIRPDGTTLSEPRVLRRIKSLAVPPAWTEVWICPSADGHIQATGRDARWRKQYRYHPLFRELRESGKYERLIAFANALPAIRATARAQMGLRGLPREKVLATVVHLLDTTLIRIGNDDYARQNRSYGLTTLKNRHAEVSGGEVRFRFTGKSGKQWSVRVRDRRVAKIIKACQELPGQELLQYLDAEGQCQGITSSDVNAYLREITVQEITAKDFRTWAGTVLTAMALTAIEAFTSPAQAKRNLRDAIKRVAAHLRNTPTICRKCYVHPAVIDAYLDGSLAAAIAAGIERESSVEDDQLQPAEAAVLALLRARLKPAAEAETASGVRRRRSGHDDAAGKAAASR